MEIQIRVQIGINTAGSSALFHDSSLVPLVQAVLRMLGLNCCIDSQTLYLKAKISSNEQLKTKIILLKT
jgi:hypothetical protein